MKTILIALLAVPLFAQTAPPKAAPAKPAPVAAPAPPPLSEALKLEIVKTQRDLLLADSRMKQSVETYNASKTEAEGLQKTLAEKIVEAGKSCTAAQAFDGNTLACVVKPPAQGQ